MMFLYFDPGLGAMIIQAIVAAVAGVLLFSKNVIYKIKLFFGLITNNDDDIFDTIDVEESDVDVKKESEKQ